MRDIWYWWDLSNIVRLPDPIPCRGNVGMWKMPSELLGVKFLDHIILGWPDCEEGRGYVSVMEWVEHQ